MLILGFFNVEVVSKAYSGSFCRGAQIVLDSPWLTNANFLTLLFTTLIVRSLLKKPKKSTNRFQAVGWKPFSTENRQIGSWEMVENSTSIVFKLQVGCFQWSMSETELFQYSSDLGLTEWYYFIICKKIDIQMSKNVNLPWRWHENSGLRKFCCSTGEFMALPKDPRIAAVHPPLCCVLVHVCEMFPFSLEV